jgi:curved DNA-binding protein CbpA
MATGGPDPYEVLNVPRFATAVEIRAAYRTLAAQYHPDHHQGNPLEPLAVARLAEINHAFEILSDPLRRAAFDAGQPAGSRPGPERAAAERAASRRFVKGAALLAVVPLVLRFGGLAARALAGLARVLFEAAASIRGTPLAALAALAALAVILIVALRRRGRS